VVGFWTTRRLVLGERDPSPMLAESAMPACQGIVARVLRAARPRGNAEPVFPFHGDQSRSSDKFSCQALADFFTLEEKFGSLKGLTALVTSGDGTHVSQFR